MRTRSADVWPLATVAACACLLVFQVVLLGKLPDHYDFWQQEFVHLAFLHRSLHSGELPLWNPQLIGGTPHLADPQAAVLYPITTLPLLLLSPAWVERLSIPFHFFLAGAGTYWLSRVLGVGRSGATVAGLTYALAPHFAPLENATYIQQTAAWAPAILAALAVAFARRSQPVFALAGALWALQLLRGFAQNWYASGLLAGAWALYLLMIHTRDRQGALRNALGLALFVAVALGLGAAQLLPSLELLRESQRASGFTLAEASGPGHITLANLLGVAGPDAEVSGAFVGGSVLVLAVAGALLGRCGGATRWFYLGLAAVSLALCLGSATPVWAIAYRLVPGFNTLHMPHRLLFAWSLALAVLAGLGAEALARTGTRLQTLALVCAGMAASFWIALRTLPGTPDGAVAGLFRVTLAAATTLGAAWLVRGASQQRISRVALSVFPALVAVDLLGYSLPRLYGTFFPPSAVYAAPPAAQWLMERQRDAVSSGQGPFRFASEAFGADSGPDYGANVQDNRRQAFLPPNVPAIYQGLEAAAGYLPIRLASSGAYFDAVNDLSRTARVLSIYDPRSRLVDLMGVRYFVAGPVDSYLSRVGSGLSLVASDGPREVVMAEPVSATDLELWSSLGDSAALADGAEVARLTIVDLAGRESAVSVRAGEHTAEWLYDAPGVAGTVRHRMAPVARSEPRDSGHVWVYRSTFPLQVSDLVARARVQVTAPGVRLNVDRAQFRVPFSALFRPVYEAPPVRVWENPRALPRAWWVGEAAVEPDEAAHLARLKSPSFESRRTALFFAPPQNPPGAGSRSSSASSADVVAESANTLAVRLAAPAPGWLVVSQTYAGGWRASVDGERTPVVRADGVLQAIPVPAGEHLVQLRYVPASFVWGATTSCVTMAVLAAWALWHRVGRRRTSAIDRGE